MHHDSHCCSSVSRVVRRRAAWMLVALATLVLRSLVPCHDAPARAASATNPVDALIAAALCSSGASGRGGEGNAPPGAPADPMPACLHCATGCESGTAAIAAGLLLAWLAPARQPLQLHAARARSGDAPWPGELARGPPALA